jgi:CubicO group peptidase (beta-lactamase class C family)
MIPRVLGCGNRFRRPKLAARGPVWVPAFIVFVWLTFITVFPSAASDVNEPVENRIGRVEKGLLPSSLAGAVPPPPWNIRDRMEFYRVPGVSIAVIHNNAIEWARGYGVLEVGGSDAVDAETLFQAASISKPVTATAILSLIQGGNLGLDDVANQRLTSWNIPDNEFTAARGVTVRHLLSHMGGMPTFGYFGYFAGQPLPTLVQILDGRRPPANSPAIRVEVVPGTEYRYSNGGFLILQQLLMDLTGTSFEQWMQTGIFDKLGMSRSTFQQPLPAGLARNAASGHLADGSAIPGRWMTYPELAAAGLWTTATDLARFVIEIQKSFSGKSNRVLSVDSIKQMLTEEAPNYGLGMQVTSDGALFYHTGANRGFRSIILGYPGTGDGAVIVTNSDRGDELRLEIARAIAAEYAWLHFRVCRHSLNVNGSSFSAQGGTGNVEITATTPDCRWTISGIPEWIQITSPLSGVGNGRVTFRVNANNGASLSSTFMIANLPFTVEQVGQPSSGLRYIGSMPHIAAQDVWKTTFTLVNKAAAEATTRLNLFGDPSGSLNLPLTLSQITSTPLSASSLERTLAANASLIIETAGPQTPPVQTGSAQLSATDTVDGFAIFQWIPGEQEAVVPLEVRDAGSYLLAFDNTGGISLGVAVQNVSGDPANIPVVIRDDNGAIISDAGASLLLEGNGHASFMLSEKYVVTANKRGTIEFVKQSGGRISVLGIRMTPAGTAFTLTTVPALTRIGNKGGSIAHIATGAGWQTTFVLVNTGTSPAQTQLNFFASGSGAPLAIPVTFPQLGNSNTVMSSVGRVLAAGSTLIVQSVGLFSDVLPTVGSAQLNTDGNVAGFVIFRYNPNGQEAVVPLEQRSADGFLLAFDNTAGRVTGIAVNNRVSQPVDVPVIVRDDMGLLVAVDTVSLAPHGHTSFTLGIDRYPEVAGRRGTVEFRTPPGGQIAALGIRMSPALTFTTLPALAK